MVSLYRGMVGRATAAFLALASTGCPEPLPYVTYVGVEGTQAQMLSCLESSASKEPVNQYGINCSAIAHFVADGNDLEICLRRALPPDIAEEYADSELEDCSLRYVGEEQENALGSQWAQACEATPSKAVVRCVTDFGVIAPYDIPASEMPGFHDVPF